MYFRLQTIFDDVDLVILLKRNVNFTSSILWHLLFIIICIIIGLQDRLCPA